MPPKNTTPSKDWVGRVHPQAVSFGNGDKASPCPTQSFEDVVFLGHEIVSKGKNKTSIWQMGNFYFLPLPLKQQMGTRRILVAALKGGLAGEPAPFAIEREG
ncbi:MAG: hypothetical protein ACR2OT_02350 [Parvibaculales bacterium]